MKKELFIDLIKKGHDMSSMYTLPQVINIECSELDIRGVPTVASLPPLQI